MPDNSLAHAVDAAPLASPPQIAGSGDETLALPSDPAVAACMQKWLSKAIEPTSADTRLFAKLIAERDVRNELALLGLQRCGWDALLTRRFAHAAARAQDHTVSADNHVDGISHTKVGITASASTAEHTDFVRTLHALLLTHASSTVHADDAQCLATIIAHACLRPDHLWRDLGLAGRDEVTWMLTRYFPTLVTLNVENLRWKKFLAGQRALSLGLSPGPAPGCPGCEDYGHCFPSQRA